jgi:hypothetical protein
MPLIERYDPQFHLTVAGGVNPHGEPNFRLIWGQSKENFAYDDITGTMQPKYLPRDSWHLEAWLPPEKCPPRGGYELCYTIGTVINPSQIRTIVDMIVKSRTFTLTERYNAIMAREEKKERDHVEEDYDILDDGVRAFHQQPFIVKP